MNSLQQFAKEDVQWTLEAFVSVVNEFLPQFLPQQEINNRVQEEVNLRLVRHYTSQQLIDKPLKQGREARYTYRHLLQMLVVRRLLMEGYSAGAIEKLMSTKNNTELEALLQGGMQLTVETANPALAFLQKLQSPGRSRQPFSVSAPAVSAPAAPAPAPEPSSRSVQSPPRWLRLEILPGLEIHVREDFTYPNSSQEQQNLLHLITQHLLTFTHRRKSP
jgi:DNA-binding transcriptional MerR regulator